MSKVNFVKIQNSNQMFVSIDDLIDYLLDLGDDAYRHNSNIDCSKYESWVLHLELALRALGRKAFDDNRVDV